MKILFGLISGIIFGLGISISGMMNPAKIFNFFDFFGTWDPSLALVMAAALSVTAIGYRFILKQKLPKFEAKFFLPEKKHLDAKLLIGSGIFGIGWGISGFCPGGVLPAIFIGHLDVYIFIASLVAGILSTKLLTKMLKYQVAISQN